MGEGDENTRFFHAQALHRFQANRIRELDVGGMVVAGHAAKAEALHAFYIALLGTIREPV